jgi:hypothetical protein
MRAYADRTPIFRYGAVTAILVLLGGLFLHFTNLRNSLAPPTARALLQHSELFDIAILQPW